VCLNLHNDEVEIYDIGRILQLMLNEID
jgi:hypothetical protein